MRYARSAATIPKGGPPVAMTVTSREVAKGPAMTETEPNGCLAAILSLFGIRFGPVAAVAEVLPYLQRDDFLSPAELSFYRVLAAALADRTVICPKVNLNDLFFVSQPQQNQRYRNKIDRKHVDFLICHPATMRPACGIELDDSSHGRRDRRDRDQFVEQVFQSAGLPLVRIPARATYSPAELIAVIEPNLIHESTRRALATASQGTPTCPKCGIPMIQRVARQGPKAGNPFYGCPNFPKCREIA